jgi:hypothetical protein
MAPTPRISFQANAKRHDHRASRRLRRLLVVLPEERGAWFVVRRLRNTICRHHHRLLRFIQPASILLSSPIEAR